MTGCKTPRDGLVCLEVYRLLQIFMGQTLSFLMLPTISLHFSLFLFFFFFFSNGHSVQKVKLSWPCSVFQRRNVIHCSLIVELLFFIEYICLYLSLPLLSLPVSTVSMFISSFHAICCCFCVIVLLSVWSGGCGITLACKGNKYAYILSTSLSYRVGLFRLSRFFWLLEKFSGEENDWLII